MKPIIICLDGITLYDVTLISIKALSNDEETEYLYTSILKGNMEIAKFNGRTHYLKYDKELSDQVTEKVYLLERKINYEINN